MIENMTFPADLRTAHPFVRDVLHDRIVGTLVGSALGDAIGLYTEFMSGPNATSTYPSRSFTLAGPKPTPCHPDMHRLKHHQGDWTDDTDHALLILLSFLHNDGQLLPADFARRLKTWVDFGLRALDSLPLGLGRTTGSVVRSPGYSEDPEGVALARWEATGKTSAPNGSLMRTHPVGLMCALGDEAAAFDAGARFSRTTHADPRCVLACAIGTALVRGVVRGEVRREEDVDATVQRAGAWLADKEIDAEELERHTRAATLADLQLDEPGKIGYVYKTLGSGILLLRLAIRRTTEAGGALLPQLGLFEELVTDLIMCGGDADTNACFAGALLGGFLGYRALPIHWKHGLRHEKWLMSKAEALCQVLAVTDGDYDAKKDRDTHLDGGRDLLTKEDMETRWKELQHAIMLKLEAEAKARAQSASAGEKRPKWGLPWNR